MVNKEELVNKSEGDLNSQSTINQRIRGETHSDFLELTQINF